MVNNSAADQKKGEKIITFALIAIFISVMILGYYSVIILPNYSATSIPAASIPISPPKECPDTRHLISSLCIGEGKSEEYCEENVSLVCDDLLDYIGVKYNIKERTDAFKDWNYEKIKTFTFSTDRL